MNIDLYNSIDINIFSCIILAVIIIHTLLYNENLPQSTRYMTVLALSILIIMIFDIAGRLDFSSDANIAHFLKYIINFIYLLLQPLPVSLGLMYLFSLFREKPFPVKYRILFMLPFIASCVVMIYSIFTDFIFWIDTANIYHRGPGMFIFGFINYSFIIPAIGLIVYHRDIIKQKTILTIIIYTLIPFTGSFLQLLNYGITTAWPSFTLALLIIYVFQERRRNGRDYLTGLLNRQSFDIKIYSRIDQYPKKSAFTLVVIDLDRFKRINDEFGHDKGDEILQAAGMILSHSVSTTDTVARYGGDEFVMILETDDIQIIENILTRIDRNISYWNKKHKMPFALSMSAGYVIYNPEIHHNYKDLFRQADAIMFEKKKERRKKLPKS